MSAEGLLDASDTSAASQHTETADTPESPSSEAPAATVDSPPASARSGDEPWASGHLLDALDADLLLHGLGVLADLLGEASETMNQCLLTIEDKLHALPISQERWVAVKAAVPPTDPVQPKEEEQTRVFGGVAVTIMKLGSAGPQDAGATDYELGYAPLGDAWALVIRKVAAPVNSGSRTAEVSELKLLRCVPLEFRLKAVREIPALLRALDVPCSDAAADTSTAASNPMQAGPAAEPPPSDGGEPQADDAAAPPADAEVGAEPQTVS
jgi:hypothetical protein